MPSHLIRVSPILSFGFPFDSNLRRITKDEIILARNHQSRSSECEWCDRMKGGCKYFVDGDGLLVCVCVFGYGDSVVWFFEESVCYLVRFGRWRGRQQNRKGEWGEGLTRWRWLGYQPVWRIPTQRRVLIYVLKWVEGAVKRWAYCIQTSPLLLILRRCNLELRSLNEGSGGKSCIGEAWLFYFS